MTILQDCCVFLFFFSDNLAPENKIFNVSVLKLKLEESGSVVECLTPDQGVAGLSLTGGTVLCP